MNQPNPLTEEALSFKIPAGGGNELLWIAGNQRSPS
jgi:hypothetical protein